MSCRPWCLALIAALAGCQASAQAGSLPHASRTMSLELNTSADSLFPLFGPVREAEWAHDWSPTMLYPSGRSQIAGAVFTTPRSHGELAYWVMTTYDTVAQHVQYVRIAPGSTAVQLDIQVRPLDARRATADVTYAYTALAPLGNESVDAFSRDFEAMKTHWQTAINYYLRTGTPLPAPTRHP